jgi:hypothetical protein
MEPTTEQTTEPPKATDTPAAPVSPATPSSTPADFKEQSDGKVTILSPAAYQRIREQGERRGRRAQIEELNKQAKEHGFESYEAMMLAATKRNGAKGQNGNRTEPISAKPGNGTSTPPRPPRDKQDHKAMARYEREKAQWEQEKLAAQRALHKANRRTRELEEERDHLDARRQLELTAVQVGVKDVDYAVELLHRETRRKSSESPEEWEMRIKAIDERKFFENLRGPHSYLFGETVVPATTGPTGERAPAPKPGEVTRRETDQGKFDARTATDAEYKARLRKLGLTPPSV